MDPDFVHRFPMPDDEALHRAGRQGLLEQKEDPMTSDEAWIAWLHNQWIDEIASHLSNMDWLAHCLRHGLIPETGRPPRHLLTPTSLDARISADLTAQRAHIGALIEDYENYFGFHAAESFARFLQIPPVLHAPLTDPTQTDLFSMK